MDWEIKTPEDAIEYIVGLIGADFEKALGLSTKILETPTDYTGPQAAMAAIKMSNYRFKIGQAAQYWKIKSAQSKNLQDRLIKDSLMAAYDALQEVINTLKLVARHEHELVR